MALRVLLLTAAFAMRAVAGQECVVLENATSDPKAECINGLLLPKWTPATNLSTGDRIARGLIYFVALAYMFVGVSIIADRFMAAIEVITSQEKEITIKRPNGETQTVVVRVWNETVANLTLMALGSSAPEILLSIIEIYRGGFEAGELGPGTIVGSAAFNLFIIIGLCVYVIPANEVRRIKHLRVFFITATWSIFAYLWLYIILKVTTPGVIEVWEGLLTFIFFPLTVLTAYIADRRLLIYKYLSKKYRMNRRGVIVEGEGDVEMSTPGVVVAGSMGSPVSAGLPQPYYVTGDGGKGQCLTDGSLTVGVVRDEEALYQEEIRQFEEHRREYVQMLKELRKKHPDCDMETLEAMARDQIYSCGPKSRAFYRIQATRMMTGGGNVLKKRQDHRDGLGASDVSLKPLMTRDDTMTTRIFFDPDHYTVMESVGEFSVTVTRQGGDLSHTVYVDYQTEDGTANSGSDYVPAAGTLVFRPGEVHKQVTLAVIDDDVFEEDEHFYVRLHNLRIGTADGRVVHVANGSASSPATPNPAPVHLLSPSMATVMIMDDDHCGIFSLGDKECEVPESIGQMQVRVIRFSGARGRVAVPYRTVDGTAKAGKDYEETHGYAVFENNETEKFFLVHIAEEDSYEKDAMFVIELGEPKQLKEGESEWSPELTISDDHKSHHHMTEDERIALMGRPRLGEITKLHVRIKESKEFKNTVDKLVKMANVSLMVGTSSWKEQFIEAITVSPGEEDENDGEGSLEKMPSCGDYVMHFLTIFWKILFAFVPPTDYWDGWLCFIVSIVGIGFLTAIIGDLASHFGCTVGLKDTVTAISFVALGTSIPDTFASKVAALNDKYADSSIGNVTGSNAVNVFLGLGIAWSMAAIYHAYHRTTFCVPPGSLTFSVTLFCSLAVVAIAVLMLRRSPKCGGELGGPAKYKAPTVVLFVTFWVFYVFISSMETYGYIKGF